MNKLMIAVYLALLICPFIAVAATGMVAVFEYKKNKIINVVRCTHFCLMVCFTFGAYFVTMLPFPSFEDVAKLKTGYAQLIPFYWTYDFLVNSGIVISDWKTVLPSLGSGIFVGVVCNIMMLFPTGYIVKRLYALDLKKIILIGFLLSLLFELTQLSGLFFVYPRPYRVFDVDDLIQNTFGMGLGGECANVLNAFFNQEKHKLRQGGEVSFRRRIKVDAIDQAILFAAMLVIVYFTRNNIEYFRRHPYKSFPIYFLIILILNSALALFTYITNGKTVGMYEIGLQLRDIHGKRLRFVQCLIRDILYGMFINLPILIAWFILLSMDRHIIVSIICTFISAILVIQYVYLSLSLVLHIITHGEKLAYERLSGTHLGLDQNVSVRQRQKVLYQDILVPQSIDEAIHVVKETLIEKKIDEKNALNIQFVVETALIEWMERGLCGNRFAVQIDNRLSRKTLIVCVPGKNIPLVKEDDSLYGIVSKVNKRVSFDSYFTGGTNVFAIELE